MTPKSKNANYKIDQLGFFFFNGKTDWYLNVSFYDRFEHNRE